MVNSYGHADAEQLTHQQLRVGRASRWIAAAVSGLFRGVLHMLSLLALTIDAEGF